MFSSRVRRLQSVILLLLLSTSTLAVGQGVIDNLRMWQAPDNTRLVFDFDQPVDHRLFTLANPDRIVIDIDNARLARPISGLDLKESVLSGVRSASKDGEGLRIVLDLREKVHPKSFLLRPNQKYGHRLVIDLHKLDTKRRSSPVLSATQQPLTARDIVVAIDAGHGGDDPGAIGPTRTLEKDVVLAIARQLDTGLGRERGITPVMIRTGDYYIGLRKRTKKAHQHKADLFISIHADAFRDSRAKGASVYTLSPGGASSEHARLLAEKENAADLIGGVSLEDKDDLLAAVLLDLSQTATIGASIDAGDQILKRLKGVARLHKPQVEQAGFRVLKSPDIPSILVETAFISNPSEERNLRSRRYQEKMAQAITAGVKHYFSTNPPPGTLLAKLRASERKHVVSRGDTLTDIAKHYQVSIATLKSVNGITGSHLRVGVVLQIPVEG